MLHPQAMGSYDWMLQVHPKLISVAFGISFPVGRGQLWQRQGMIFRVSTNGNNPNLQIGIAKAGRNGNQFPEVSLAFQLLAPAHVHDGGDDEVLIDTPGPGWSSGYSVGIPQGKNEDQRQLQQSICQARLALRCSTKKAHGIHRLLRHQARQQVIPSNDPNVARENIGDVGCPEQ